jgi:hypothetical protein
MHHSGYFHAELGAACCKWALGEVAVQLRDHRRPFANAAADPLHRARPCIAHREYAGDIRFERQRLANAPFDRHARRHCPRTRLDESVGVKSDATRP